MSKSLEFNQFMAEIDEKLETFSLDEIKNVFRKLAQEVPPLKRNNFLDRLNNIIVPEENLLEEISQFKKKVDEQYYYEGWGWDQEHNKKRAFGDESWTREMDNLFVKTFNEIEKGSYELAETAFARLFKILETGEQPPRYLPGPFTLEDMIETELAKAKTLYLCCIYHNTSKKERLKKIWKTLNNKYLSDITNVNLTTLVNLSKEPLPDFNNFLANWIKILRKVPKKTSISSFLLREAIILKGGTKAIAQFALNEGQEYPESYLDWIKALEEEKNYEQVMLACLNGLKNLNKDYLLRSQIALKLVKAGGILNDEEIQLKAWREAFYSNPTLEHFLSLLSLAKKQNREKEEIEIVLARIFELLEDKEKYSYSILDKLSRAKATEKLLCQIYLISGNFKTAFNRYKDKRPLNWSYSDNPKGLLISYLIYLLCPSSPVPKMVKHTWETYGFYDLKKEHMQVVKNIFDLKFSQKEEQHYFNWCIFEVGERVDKVLNTTYRSNHHKAAEILIAMGEVIAIREDVNKGFNFIKKYHSKHMRKRNFRQLVREFISKSKLFHSFEL